MSRPAALTLVAEHGERVGTAVVFVHHQQQDGRVKSPAGLVVDDLTLNLMILLTPA